MVNSCTGKMGHAAAEALVQSGFSLVPHTLCGLSVGVAVKNIGVRGVPVSLVGKDERQAVLDRVKEQYPGMVVLDYTVAHCVDESVRFYAENGLPFVMGTVGGDREEARRVVAAAGGYAVLSSHAGDQAASLYALLVSLGAPLPVHFEQYSFTTLGGRGSGFPGSSGGGSSGADSDAGALDLLHAGAAGEITRTLRLMGIQVDEENVHRMRAARQQRVGGRWLEPGALGGGPSLRELQGRGGARSCRVVPPGGEGPALLLCHYGLDRTAFAAGAVQAVRFLAARVAEGCPQRVYDMVDVLRAVQEDERQAAEAAAAARPAPVYASNVVTAGPAAVAAMAAS